MSDRYLTTASLPPMIRSWAANLICKECKNNYIYNPFGTWCLNCGLNGNTSPIELITKEGVLIQECREIPKKLRDLAKFLYIKYLHEFLRYPKEELLKFKSIGPKSVESLEQVMSKNGLVLRDRW